MIALALLLVSQCVDEAKLKAALDDVGGIEPAEEVRVSATQLSDSDYELDIFIALIGVPPLSRKTPLRAVECKDVPDLVAVLVMTMRREREAKAVVVAKTPERINVDTWRPAPQPRRHSSTMGVRQADVSEASSLCTGPPTLGNFSLGISAGYEPSAIVRGQLDASYVLGRNVSLVGVVDGSRWGVGAHLGLGWKFSLEGAEISPRVLLGLGAGVAVARRGVTIHEYGATTSYISPIVALRARLGWFFVETGGIWHIIRDPFPGIYLSGGMALFAPS
jgi:hypothetical protein